MRVLIVGLGVQGKKRRNVAAADVIATVDPTATGADYKSIYDVNPDSYDAALCCVPDDPKFKLLSYLLGAKKNVLVEKPLWVAKKEQITELESAAKINKVQCYTAYNHRFEPHFVTMKNLIDSNELGKIYRVRCFYGNGTASLVKASPWRDKGAGVLPDLASHLLDTIRFWFGDIETKFEVSSCSCFENAAPDHVLIKNEVGPIKFELEVTLLSWKNHFVCDVLAEKGSAHIESLCKWGPTKFIHRRRVMPSGVPSEVVTTLFQPDPTWEAEYRFFKEQCFNKVEACLGNDMWLGRQIENLSEQALVLTGVKLG